MGVVQLGAVDSNNKIKQYKVTLNNYSVLLATFFYSFCIWQKKKTKCNLTTSPGGRHSPKMLLINDCCQP